MKTISVVIPYYQRDAELILKALGSVAAQRLPEDVSVTIQLVDDESPVPFSEVQGLLPQDFPVPIVVSKQANAGPGAARNRGIEAALASGAHYIAFLDSDDFWYEGHLASALSMLDSEVTFYFSNSLHDDVDSMFHSKFIRRQHRRTDQGYDPQSRVIAGGDFLPALLDECIPHTSQVVFDLQRHPDIRFTPRYRRAAEDHTFWIELTQQVARLAYSTVMQGERGRGVSIYRSTLAWDMASAADRLLEEIVFRRALFDRFGHRADSHAALDAQLSLKEAALVFIVARGAKRKPIKALSVLGRALAANPRMIRRLPGIALSMPAFYRELKAGRVTI
jgi:succinoglycan biosynthesis protein ExoW